MINVLFCKVYPEIVGHALWNYVAVQDVWSAGCVRIQQISYQSNDFTKVWREFFQKLKNEELEIAAVITKLIWMRRNAFVHGMEIQAPYLIHKASKDLLLFQSAQGAHLEVSLTTQRCVWLKPPSDLYKVNWDAVVDESRGKVGI